MFLPHNRLQLPISCTFVLWMMSLGNVIINETPAFDAVDVVV